MKKIFAQILFEKNLTVVVIFSIALLSACKGSQQLGTKDSSSTGVDFEKVEKGESVRNVLQKINDSTFQYQSFSANFSVNLDAPDLNQSFSGQIRMLYDSIIWISAGKFGIEAFRILINRDSIFILNKLEQSLKVQDIGFLSNYLSGFNGLKHLQNILLGNPITDVFSANCELEIINQNYIFTQKASDIFPFRISMDIDSLSFRPIQWNIINKYDKKASISYLRTPSKVQTIPEGLSIETAFPISLNLEMNYTKITVNQNIQTPFTISDKVRRL